METPENASSLEIPTILESLLSESRSSSRSLMAGKNSSKAERFLCIPAEKTMHPLPRLMATPEPKANQSYPAQ